MSNSVDQRIVQMQFDNAQFERGVGTTLASLKALDQGLQLKNGLTGLTDVDAAASRLNFSELVSDVNDLNDKLSALGVIGFTALSRLTNSLMDLGTGVVKALTVDPLTDGLDEYKLKMDSITTILSNTKSKGTSLDEVNEVLAELNDYADQTIYNFAEMTRNIGTFTAAGVDLKTSASAIKGIANLAAVSGSNSQQASVAMYQLSQALASGTVKLMDWNSVLNAGMGGQVFQDALIRTAEHLGTGAKAAIEAEGSFRESLKQGWLTSEVLTETLNQFTMLGTEEERVHLQQLGYTEEEIAAVFEMGKTATDAATKVKTFQQLIDTTKEALGSGWATSWEYIIGNMEQAQELWTGISTAINGVIDALSNPRNEFLKTWNEQGGWDALLGKEGTLAELSGVLTDLLKPLADAYNQVFSSVLDPEGLGMMAVEASKGLLELVKSVRHFIETSETAKVVAFILRTAFTGLFEIVKLVGMAVGGAFIAAFKLVGTVLKTAVKAIEFVITTVKNLYEAITSFASANVFEPLSRFAEDVLHFGELGDLIKHLGEYFKQLFDVFAHGADAMSNGVIDDTKKLISEDFARIAGRVGGALRTFADGLSHVFSVVKDVGSKGAVVVFDKLQKVWERIVPILEKVRGKIVTAWNTLRDAFVNAGFSLDPFIEMFQGFGESFGRFFESVFSEGFSIDKVFELFKELGENVQTFMGELGPAFEAFTSTIGAAVSGEFSGAMETIWGWLSNVEGPLSSIINGLKDLVNAIGEAGSSLKLPFGDSGATETVSGMADAVETASKAVWDFSTVLQMIKNPMKTVSNFISKGLNGIAEGINEFIESLDTPAIASLVEKFTDLAILGGVGAGLYQFFNLVKNAADLLGSWKAVCTALETGLTTLNKTLGAAKTAMYASVLVSVAVSIGILVAALYALTKMDTDEINEALPVLGKIAAGLIVVVLAFSVAARIAKANAASIMAMSGVIMSIITALFAMVAMTTILGLIPEGVVEQGEAALAGIVRMLTLLIVVMGVVTKASTSAASSIGLLSQLALALSLLAGMVVVLGLIPETVLQQGLGVVILLSIIFGFLTAAISHFGKGALASASGLIEMAAAIAVLAGAIMILSLADSDKLAGAVIAVAVMIGVLTGFLKLTEKINPYIFKEAAVSLIIFSAAVGILAAALAGLAAVSAMGGDLFGAGVALVAMLLALSVAALALSKAGLWMIEGAQAMLIVAGAVALLSAALIALSMMTSEDSWRALGQLALVMLALSVAFAAVAFVATVLEPGLYALTAVLLGLAAVLIGFGAGALMFATAVTMLSQLTPASVDSMIEAFQRLCVGLWESKEEIAMAIAGIGMAISAGILAAIPGIIAVLLGLVGAIIAVLVAAGPILGEGAVQMVAGLIDGFATGLDENGPAIRDAFMHLIETILSGLFDALSFGINEISYWLYDNTGGMFGNARPASEEAAQETVDAYVSTLQNGKDDVANATNEMTSGQIEELLKSQADSLGVSEETMAMLQETFGEDLYTGSINTDALAAAGIDIESLCGEIGVGGGDELASQLNSVLSDYNFDFFNVKNSSKEELNEAAHEGAESYKEGWAEETSSMDLSSETAASISDTEVFKQQGELSANAMNTSFASNLFLDSSTAIVEAANAATAPEKFEAAGEADAAAIGSGIEAGSSGLSDKTASITKSAFSSVSQLSYYASSICYNVGHSMSEGLLSGINSLSWKISSAASSIVSSAASAMRAVAKINSPSKLTAEIGSSLAEGLAVGMTDNVNMPNEAAESLVKSAVGVIKTQASYLSGLLDDIDENPVITPVLDLSQIETGLNSVSNMFPQDQLITASAIGRGIGSYGMMDGSREVVYGDQYHFNLQYDAGADATDIVMGMARSMRARSLLEG